MEVAHTSMIHAAAPHFLWLFAVRYSAHQLNLWPCVSLAETSPTLRWTGKVGKATLFRVWSLLARYVAPDRNRKLHWDVAKRVLRYLGSTSGMGLVFASVLALFPGGLPARLWFSVPVVRLRSPQVPCLHRSYAGSPTC
ncbi:unnamed protein product [Closterium sp. NIES-53]